MNWIGARKIEHDCEQRGETKKAELKIQRSKWERMNSKRKKTHWATTTAGVKKIRLKFVYGLVHTYMLCVD